MIGAAAAVHAAIGIQRLLPGEIFQLAHADGFQGVKITFAVRRRFDLAARIEIGEENIG